jgi:HK97 family phage prohead protease
MGDVVDPHAFDRTIVEARAKHPQNLWPVWWQHGYSEPENSIGVITDAYVTDEGLIVEGRLAVDSNAKALEVYRGMLEDRIREWSISYGVIREHKEKINGKSVNVLDELELLEISSVMAGANRYTRTLQVKGAGARTRACGCSALQLCRQHAAKLDASQRTKRAGRCPTYGKTQTFNVQPPVPSGTVPWAQCACGALVGWSGKMTTEQHVAEMRKVRAHVGSASKVDPDGRLKVELESILLEQKVRNMYRTDRDLLDQLDALDPAGAKHTQRVTDRASDACRDGAAVADTFRERITYPSQDSYLLRIAASLRGFAQRLAARGNDLDLVARQAVQSGQALLAVAQTLRAAGLDVDELVSAGDKIIAACEPIVSRQLAPPPAVELSGGPKSIPMTNARMFVIEEQSAAQPINEESFSLEIGQVATESFRLEPERDAAPVPVESGEYFTLDMAGYVDATESTVEDEGQEIVGVNASANASDYVSR